MHNTELETTRIGNRIFHWGRRTYVMGILNVTPDSFSGDGLGYDVEGAVEQAIAMQQAGADIIDVGGESTRPPGPAYGSGAGRVPADEELTRVLPVVRRLAEALDIPVSIDTYKAEVAAKAVAAGAALINDVWALQRDPELAQVARDTGVPIVLNHNQEGYEYEDMFAQVTADLQRWMKQALEAGVPENSIIVDPGIGFGKRTAHNLELLRRLDEFKSVLGRPVLVGTSRKSFIGEVLGGLPPQKRVDGTAATVALSIAKGADIVRVHDVKEMAQVACVTDAILHGWPVDSGPVDSGE